MLLLIHSKNNYNLILNTETLYLEEVSDKDLHMLYTLGLRLNKTTSNGVDIKDNIVLVWTHSKIYLFLGNNLYTELEIDLSGVTKLKIVSYKKELNTLKLIKTIGYDSVVDIDLTNKTVHII